MGGVNTYTAYDLSGFVNHSYSLSERHFGIRIYSDDCTRQESTGVYTGAGREKVANSSGRLDLLSWNQS